MEFQIEGNQYISAAEFGAKFQSKKEIYVFLTVENNAYLPPNNVITLYFMRDLVSGKKKFLRGDQVKTFVAPYYDSITLEIMLTFASKYQDVVQYLPEYKECLKLPRAFLVNLLNSTIDKDFRDFVHEKIMERNQNFMVQKNQLIEIDPQLKKAFQNSTYLTNQKGIGNSMLKSNIQRRRTKQEILQEKNQALVNQREIEEKIAKLNELQQKVAEMEHKAQKGDEAMHFINSLVDKGILSKDNEGNINIYQK